MKSLPPVSPTRRGIRSIAADVFADLLPHAVEDGRTACEVDAGQLRRIEKQVGDLLRVAREEVDDAGRQARGFEHLQRVVAAQHRRRCRLPDHGVPHQRRRGGQVAADGGEVERSDRVDEALERAILHRVPHAGAADRLLAVELLREVGVEAPEVDHLRRGVNLRLKRRLRLPEHGRRVDRRPPGRGEELRGAQHDRRAIFPGPRGPLATCLGGGRNRLLHVLGACFVILGQHVLMVVRHHGFLDLAGADLLPADDERNLDLLRRHRRETRLQLGALRRARRIAAVRHR